MLCHQTRSPFLLICSRSSSRYGAPKIPVITPTGYRTAKRFCPTSSEARIRTTPTSAEASRLVRPFPTILDAIGPDRKATDAMGPVIEVATAVRSNAHRMEPNRTRWTGAPSVMGYSSPNCITCKLRFSTIKMKPPTKTVMLSTGTSDIWTPFKLPRSHRNAVATSYSEPFNNIHEIKALSIACIPMPIRIIRLPEQPCRSRASR